MALQELQLPLATDRVPLMEMHAVVLSHQEWCLNGGETEEKMKPLKIVSSHRIRHVSNW